MTALSASGLKSDRFVFEGFLPAKETERREHLETLITNDRTLIFYEAPHRVQKTLQDIATVLGSDRQIVLARELTKLHEEFWRGTVEAAIAHYKTTEPKGEFTLIVSGAEPTEVPLTEDVLKAELLSLMQQGISRSQASRQLSQQTALPRRQLYQLALQIEL